MGAPVITSVSATATSLTTIFASIRETTDRISDLYLMTARLPNECE